MSFNVAVPFCPVTIIASAVVKSTPMVLSKLMPVIAPVVALVKVKRNIVLELLEAVLTNVPSMLHVNPLGAVVNAVWGIISIPPIFNRIVLILSLVETTPFAIILKEALSADSVLAGNVYVLSVVSPVP